MTEIRVFREVTTSALAGFFFFFTGSLSRSNWNLEIAKLMGDKIVFTQLCHHCSPEKKSFTVFLDSSKNCKKISPYFFAMSLFIMYSLRGI